MDPPREPPLSVEHSTLPLVLTRGYQGKGNLGKASTNTQEKCDPITKAKQVAVSSGLMVACMMVGAMADRRGSCAGMQVNGDSSCFERLYPLSLQGLENFKFLVIICKLNEWMSE